jgi:DnaJ-class molecular chaperone
LEVPIRIKQAVRGDQVEVPTPDGSLLKLKVPAGTQSGKRARVRGRGMPTKNGRGHFYARFMIRAPEPSEDPAYLEALDLLDTYYE